MVRAWATAIAAALGLTAACHDASPDPPSPLDVAWGEACEGSDCAPEIPMTGHASPRFVEVDIAMRQLVKWRCWGAATLAISLHGRRVYKRGFGRMRGPAAPDLPGCNEGPMAGVDPFDPAAGFVPPDAPLRIGSVTKTVTAAIVRELVQQRLVERGLPAEIRDVEDARLVDPALDLLPAELRALLDGSACPDVLVDDREGCARACDGAGVDLRWRDVTIGDLLAHTTGMPGVAADWEAWTVANLAALRGYTTEAEWAAEDADLRTRAPGFAPAIERARAWLQSELGAAPVYFVHRHDPRDAYTLDEYMKVFVTRCLDPWAAPGQHAPGATYGGSYSNSNFAILDRVVAHLSTTGRLAADTGYPAQEDDAELGRFLARLGIDRGVTGPHAMFHYQRALGVGGPPYAGPEPRAWSPSARSYYPVLPDQKRPFCVYRGGTCDFGPWLEQPRLRFAWDFRAGASGPRWAPFDLAEHSLAPGTGALAVEGPALLRVINEYAAGLNDSRQGRRRDACGPDCAHLMGKRGGLGGGAAVAISLAPEWDSVGLPEPDAQGRLTEDGALTRIPLRGEAGVDFVLMIAQSGDGKPEGALGYANADEAIRFALAKVDWAAVADEVAAQDRTVIGMDVSGGRTTLWYASDLRRSYAGAPGASAEPLAEARFALPATRIGADVRALAATGAGAERRVLAWYDDGHFSSGTDDDLRGPSAPYVPAAGRTYRDLVAVALAPEGAAIAWYRDGTLSRGVAEELGRDEAGTPFTCPEGQDPADIAAIAREGERVWTRWADGSVSLGTPTALGVAPR